MEVSDRVRKPLAIVNAAAIGDRPSGALSRFLSLYPKLFATLSHFSFVVLVPSDFTKFREFTDLANVRLLRLPFNSRSRSGRVALSVAPLLFGVRPSSATIVDNLCNPVIWGGKSRIFLTVHDIRRLCFGDYGLERHLLKRMLSEAARREWKIVTVSHTMRRSILRQFPNIDLEVVYNCLDRRKGRFTANDGATSQQDGVLSRATDPLILAVGHIERRKNYGTLIDAFEMLHARGVHSGLRLVIVGRDGGELPDIKHRVSNSPQKDYIEIRESVDDVELQGLYRRASCFVFPSLYEGFGIPILEAMAFDVPLALSRIGVFQEIAGNAALFFDANNCTEMADCIGSIVADPATTAERISLARLRLEEFSSDVQVDKLAAMYLRCAGESGVVLRNRNERGTKSVSKS